MRMLVNTGKSTPLLDQELKKLESIHKNEQNGWKINNNLNAPIYLSKAEKSLTICYVIYDISINGIFTQL